MTNWLIRAGKNGEDENEALEKGLAIIGWEELHDVSKVSSFKEMKTLLGKCYPEWKPRAIVNNAAQVWAFSHKIKKGAIVALPLKTRSTIALGKIIGDYEYKEGRHLRKVEWVREDIPRKDFGLDLLFSLGAFMTVCKIARNNAEDRLNKMLAGKPDPYLKSGRAGGKNQPDDEGEDALLVNREELVDIEGQAFDQIRGLIESKFKSHNLTRLVEAILNVQGYQTWIAPPGPDGGVDILAGYGPMGFDPPRICVQVKSGSVQNDLPIRELEGVMSRMKAEQGLFVSWEGFNKTALASNKEMFFKVRLWDDKKLMTALLENYENMSDQIQAELPLKRIWAVVPEED